MVNIQHVTLNGTTQLAKLCMSIGTKGGLAKKGHTLMACNRLPMYEEPTVVSQESCQMVRIKP